MRVLFDKNFTPKLKLIANETLSVAVAQASTVVSDFRLEQEESLKENSQFLQHSVFLKRVLVSRRKHVACRH